MRISRHAARHVREHGGHLGVQEGLHGRDRHRDAPDEEGCPGSHVAHHVAHRGEDTEDRGQPQEGARPPAEDPRHVSRGCCIGHGLLSWVDYRPLWAISALNVLTASRTVNHHGAEILVWLRLRSRVTERLLQEPARGIRV